MRTRITGTAFVAFIAAMAIAAQAALTSGSLLNGTITGNYSSNHAYVGQSVVLGNVTSNDGSGSVTGGTLYGHVSSVQAASQGHPGRIAFVFTKLVTGAGATYFVNTMVTRMQSNTKNNTLKEVGGAVGGMLLGNAIGKTIFHTGAGGFLGAAGGFLLAKNNRENVNVQKGSVIQVRVNSITRRQSH